ncbi:hypothetical protein [Cohnella cholangitidis]|uniref:Ethanolamine utilization protein n=1 Tax=Cohnella cholangitidis TaxID=2598458 RepID=A0A7G5C7E2_9BACL|nr:hypothetical protein [Cohnella cholangitidis]QMV45126.1 hypothetical protein FPL14_22140 [Cohnella cholangitidis]
MEIKPMVESIVRELISEWHTEPAVQPPQPKLLYIFCDSAAHEAYSDHFIHLRNHGICHDLLFLDGETSAWLGMHKLECGGAGRILTADEFAPAPLEVPLDYAGIVIPEIDLDNAARIALGMKGTIKSEIVFSALVQGKFVLVGEDSPGLKRADRRTLKTIALPQPYVHLFSYYKQELRMYGVEFGEQKRLAELAVRKCGKEKATSAQSAIATTTQQPSAPEEQGLLAFENKLVSSEWVIAQLMLRRFHTLIIRRRTLISPLALDLLKDNGIAVQYADEG